MLFPIMLSHPRSWDMTDIIIAVVVLAAICGIAYLAIQWFEIQIPAVVWKILGIVFIAFIAIIAIRFLLTL